MKNLALLICTLLALVVTSCQSEGDTVIQDTTNNFTKTSPISSLISRVSQYETTTDNVLDGTSNCSIKLPAHVTVNGQYVYVTSAAGYQEVQNIKNQSNMDDDKVHFSFPVTMIYPNYYEHMVSNETDFNTIMAGYGDDGPYHEVSCLNFNFPISINIYNTNNQVASTTTITGDSQFYNFIHNLNEAQIVGIVFPIVVTDSNSQQVTIHNNDELEDAINTAVGACNTVVTPTSLSDILSSGSWYISYSFHGSDCTNQYNDYDFTFNANGECTAVKNSTTIHGDWDINTGPTQRLDLHFDGDQLHDLETNWDVQEYTSTYVRLRKQNGGGGGGGPWPEQSSYLSFTKNP